MHLLTRTRDFYARYERPISSASLIGGFVFDAIVLKRVDLFWENIWTAGHIVIVAVCIILINLQEDEHVDASDPTKAHFWYVNILQFFFGGLLSTYLVFYFRSTTLAVTWPFLLLLAIAFIANESLKRQYTRLTFQISLFYLSILAFAIFIVPVIFHRIGTDIFLLSGAASLAALVLFLAPLGFFARAKFKKSRNALRFSVAAIFAATNILYFMNLIPPIPLSLKDAHIFHSIVRTASGNYTAQAEHANWFTRFFMVEDVHVTLGETIYAYSAIFSPAAFSTNIVHEWQTYNERTGAWTTTSRVTIPTTGGRDGGYRTYSFKSNAAPGTWRVNIETVDGQTIGRLRFNIIGVDTSPPLVPQTK